MVLPLIGPLLSAGASIIGGLLQKSSADAANKQSLDAAQHGVEWRVNDAKAAGIHPLAALGMNPISLSPMAVGDLGIADAGRALGQGLDRAEVAGETARGVQGKLALQMAQTQLEGAQIDNDIKRAELASRVRRSMVGAQAPVLLPPVEDNTSRGADIGGQTLPFGGLNLSTGRWPTSEEVERQYGDVVQEGYGGFRLLHDAFIGPNRWTKPVDEAVGRSLHELFGVNPAY